MLIGAGLGMQATIAPPMIAELCHPVSFVARICATSDNYTEPTPLFSAAITSRSQCDISVHILCGIDSIRVALLRNDRRYK